MSVSTPPNAGMSDGERLFPPFEPVHRESTETKSSFKTTELFVFLAAVAGVLVAAAVVDETSAGGFDASQAWLFVTILTVGYLVSRGLAKSGSREQYTRDDRS